MRFAAVAIAAFLVLAIALPGGAFLIAPLCSQPTVEWVRVASLSDLAADGTPQMVAIRVPQSNGWTRLPDANVGCLFLRRIPETDAVTALRTHHSRGNAIAFDAVQRLYRCQCWGVEFDLNGQLLHPERDAGLSAGIPSVDAKVVDDDVYVRWPHHGR